MAIQKISIDDFLLLSNQHPVFDVRSPLEYLQAHIPGAHSLPIFNDEERRIIGTAYKQQSRQQAIKIGLDFYGVKMKDIIEEVEKIFLDHRPQAATYQRPVAEGMSSTMIHGTGDGQPPTTTAVIVHCWRGGMRSAAVAWLLDLYGYKVYSLTGGYKAFRNWVLKQFEKPFSFKIIGGYTGSGKTVLLGELKRSGYPVVDLERLANHKGSAFGDLGESIQPSQEMFENLLALELLSLNFLGQTQLNEIWVEDESQRIGKLTIPGAIWEKMRNSPVHFIDIPFEERLHYILNAYGGFEKEKLAAAILRIQKRLGGLETRNAIGFLENNNILACFSILLKYYDKCYIKGLYNRKNVDSLLNKIPCTTVSTSNINLVLLLQNTFK